MHTDNYPGILAFAIALLLCAPRSWQFIVVIISSVPIVWVLRIGQISFLAWKSLIQLCSLE